MSVLSTELTAEASIFGWGPWNVQSLSGSIIAEGIYRQQRNELNLGFSDYMKSTAFRGLLRLNTSSFIWHPNFLIIDGGLEFSPDAHKENYLVIPDRSESNTAEKVNIQATFLANAPVTLSLSANLGHTYSSRDIATDIEYVNKAFGGLLHVKNNLIPFSLGYNISDWQDKEIKTQRIFSYSSKNINAQAHNSIGDQIYNQLNYSNEVINTDYTGNSSLRSQINNLNLTTRVNFSSDGFDNLNSNISYNDIIGYQRLRKWEANEDMYIKLPEDFKLRMNYQYYNQSINSVSIITHNPFIQLEHQLYKSLKSYAYFRYTDAKNISFNELRNIWGIGFKYQKMIPTGTMNINYEFRLSDERRHTSTNEIRIEHEEYSLDDSKIILINNAYVKLGSVIVKNSDNSIIYQKDIDYILIPRGEFTEIKRVPGGRIANNDLIYIDYTTGYQNYNSFASIAHTLDTRINLFNRFIEFYFRLLDNHYKNVNVDSFSVMKTINQKLLGMQVNIDNLVCGIEWDSYFTNIIPYESLSLFARYNTDMIKDLSLSLQASYQKYNFITIMEQQDYAELNSKIGYRLNSWSQINLDAGYRLQSGTNLDLNLTNVRAEYSVVFYKVILTAGFEAYYRSFMSEINDYKGFFVRLERRF